MLHLTGHFLPERNVLIPLRALGVDSPLPSPPPGVGGGERAAVLCACAPRPSSERLGSRVGQKAPRLWKSRAVCIFRWWDSSFWEPPQPLTYSLKNINHKTKNLNYRALSYPVAPTVFFSPVSPYPQPQSNQSLEPSEDTRGGMEVSALSYNRSLVL